MGWPFKSLADLAKEHAQLAEEARRFMNIAETAQTYARTCVERMHEIEKIIGAGSALASKTN